MTTIVTTSGSTLTDSAGSGHTCFPGRFVGLTDEDETSTTSTLGSEGLAPVLVDQSDDLPPFAAELGRRAWRRRQQEE